MPAKCNAAPRIRHFQNRSASVTNTISEAGINIEGARVSTTRDQKALQSFDLTVSDVDTLNAVMKKLERIRGVQCGDALRGLGDGKRRGVRCRVAHEGADVAEAPVLE